MVIEVPLLLGLDFYRDSIYVVWKPPFRYSRVARGHEELMAGFSTERLFTRTLTRCHVPLSVPECVVQLVACSAHGFDVLIPGSRDAFRLHHLAIIDDMENLHGVCGYPGSSEKVDKSRTADTPHETL
jgi:hypothetical protein